MAFDVAEVDRSITYIEGKTVQFPKDSYVLFSLRDICT